MSRIGTEAEHVRTRKRCLALYMIGGKQTNATRWAKAIEHQNVTVQGWIHDYNVQGVDGLSSYVKAFQQAFRTPWQEKGDRGRPRLIAWHNIAIVQLVKQRQDPTLNIDRRLVQGDQTMTQSLLQFTQAGGVINTAFIERLNVIFRPCSGHAFRQRLAWLARRTRNLAQQTKTLIAAMFVLGCFYNFCDYHRSLKI